MQRINLSDIVWSRQQYTLADIPKFAGPFPVAAIVTSSESGNCEDEDDDWPNYQMFCICGHSYCVATINSSSGQFHLPCSFPIKVSVKKRNGSFSQLFNLDDVERNCPLPVTAKFDTNISVTFKDVKVKGEFEIREIAYMSGLPCTSYVTVNGYTTAENALMMCSCKEDFTFKVGIRLKSGKEDDWRKMMAHIVTNPGQFLVECVWGKDVYFKERGPYEGLILHVNPDDMTNAVYEALGSTKKTEHSTQLMSPPPSEEAPPPLPPRRTTKR